MNFDFDVCVVGAGVVGLACGRALSAIGRSVIVLEKESMIGSHTSSRNSEVIHAGMYYPTDSLKSQLCVRGNYMMYEYCKAYDVPYRQCGKYIVATNADEITRLEEIMKQAELNGVPDMSWVDETPYDFIKCERALFSGSSGTVDVHALMSSLAANIEEQGGVIALECAVEHITKGFNVHTNQGAFKVRHVVNAAGLWAQDIAKKIDGMDQSHIEPIQYARGHYFKPNISVPTVNHLIYPVPAKDSLGTHITMDMAGQIRFGPDLEWIDEVDYSFGKDRDAGFTANIQRYWPSFPDNVLVKDYTGIRPKIASRDFIIQGVNVHGIDGLVNLIGIDSPGLTSSLAIAEQVVSKMTAMG